MDSNVTLHIPVPTQPEGHGGVLLLQLAAVVLQEALRHELERLLVDSWVVVGRPHVWHKQRVLHEKTNEHYERPAGYWVGHPARVGVGWVA